jgi:hypothetical protein
MIDNSKGPEGITKALYSFFFEGRRSQLCGRSPVLKVPGGSLEATRPRYTSRNQNQRFNLGVLGATGDVAIVL